MSHALRFFLQRHILSRVYGMRVTSTWRVQSRNNIEGSQITSDWQIQHGRAEKRRGEYLAHRQIQRSSGVAHCPPKVLLRLSSREGHFTCLCKALIASEVLSDSLLMANFQCFWDAYFVRNAGAYLTSPSRTWNRFRGTLRAWLGVVLAMVATHVQRWGYKDTYFLYRNMDADEYTGMVQWPSLFTQFLFSLGWISQNWHH